MKEDASVAHLFVIIFIVVSAISSFSLYQFDCTVGPAVLSLRLFSLFLFIAVLPVPRKFNLFCFMMLDNMPQIEIRMAMIIF